MTLISCPECERRISSSATTCPHCGYPLVEPWTARVERAWRQGFRHAWIAAVGFPAVWLVLMLAQGDLGRAPHLLLNLVPWLFITASWGLLAGLAAIAVAAFVRSRWLPGNADADPWQWTVAAQLVVVVLFGAFLSIVF